MPCTRSSAAIGRSRRFWAATTRRSSATSSWLASSALAPPRRRARVTDDYRGLIAQKVEETRGRITARRLLRLLRAAGYEGSERSLRRAVRGEKRALREREAREGRVFRPWRSGPGEWLICDWGSAGTVETPAGPRPLSFFGSVLGYSRHRQLTFSCSERFPALATGLASNLEQLERLNVPLEERLLTLGRERHHERGARVARAHHKQPDRDQHPGQKHLRLAQSTSAVTPGSCTWGQNASAASPSSRRRRRT